MPATERTLARLQFPRRVVLLLLAFGLAWLVRLALANLAFNGVELGRSRANIAEIVLERLPVSLALLSLVLLLAFVQALVAAAVAVGIHSLEKRNGQIGSVLKGAGRLWVFGQAAMPIFVLAVFLMLIFVIRLDLLPGAGLGEGGWTQRLPRMILPAVSLALLPAVLTAQVMAREATLARDITQPRIWMNALLKGAAALAGQMGGMLSALIILELIFAIPGIGRMFIDGFMLFEAGLFTGALAVMAVLILVGRLASELFGWLARLLNVPAPAPWPEAATPWRTTARRIWVGLALVLLLVPLGVLVGGLTVDPERSLESSIEDRELPPSPEHPLGTDSLGRDVQARVLRGGAVSLGMALVTAILVTLLGGVGGALTGWLASRRTLWAESLADVLMLPADVLLFFPVVPAAGLLALTGRMGSWLIISLAVAVWLIPRGVRYFQTLWLAGSLQIRDVGRLLTGLGSLALAALFAGFGTISALDFVGLGVPPPTATLGSMLADAVNRFQLEGAGLMAPAVAAWLCSLALFVSADALAGYFPTKEAMTHMNE